MLWRGIRFYPFVPITDFLEEVKNKADKQLAHLSLWRLKLKKDGKKGWHVGTLSRDIEKVIDKFEDLKNSN